MASGVTFDYSNIENKPQHVEQLLPKFNKQARCFQQLGRQLEAYVKSIRGMKAAMVGVHENVLTLCDKSWPRFKEFKSLLEDQAELWTLMEVDIHKMGTGFQKYADEFYTVLQSINIRKEILAELGELKKKRANMEKMASDQSEKVALMANIKEKSKELHDIDVKLVDQILKVQNGQWKFVTEQYGQFLAAQSVFCRDSLSILNYVPSILNQFSPKPKFQHNQSGN